MGHRVAQLVKHLPSAQVLIPRSWDQAPTSDSLLSWEPASPSPLLMLFLALSLFFSLSQINKKIFKKIKLQLKFIMKNKNHKSRFCLYFFYEEQSFPPLVKYVLASSYKSQNSLKDPI